MKTEKCSESNNKSGIQLEKVFKVNEKDIEKGTYSVFDVVLPLPCPVKGDEGKDRAYNGKRWCYNGDVQKIEQKSIDDGFPALSAFDDKSEESFLGFRGLFGQ